MCSRVRLWSLLGNGQRLDGGAMFGNAPKALWSRWAQASADNSVELACRSLLVRETSASGAERHLLFDVGIGAFMNASMRKRFGVSDANHVLLSSLERVDLSHEDIDVVVFSHLHFDHAGGALQAFVDDATTPQLLFPNARFVVSEPALERACNPHVRDKASFIEPLPGALEASGRLCLVPAGAERFHVLGENFSLHWSNGHTPGMMLTEVRGESPVVFAADLVPALPWMYLPITMGYDRYAELMVDEKRRILGDLLNRRGRLFFTHDPQVAMVQIAAERKMFSPAQQWETLSDFSV